MLVGKGESRGKWEDVREGVERGVGRVLLKKGMEREKTGGSPQLMTHRSIPWKASLWLDILACLGFLLTTVCFERGSLLSIHNTGTHKNLGFGLPGFPTVAPRGLLSVGCRLR